MEEEKKESGRHQSLFERIKANILKRNEEDDAFEEEEAIDSLAKEAKEEKRTDRGVINISSESLLFSVWKEWKEAAEEEGREDRLEQEFQELEKLDLVLEDSKGQKIPLSNEEIELEKERAAAQIMIKAKQYNQMTKPNELGIAPDVDAYMVVHVAKSHMAAWAFVFPPSGEGNRLTKSQVYMALSEYSVSAGIDREVIRRIVEEQPYFKMIPIAYGKEMIAGEDGMIEEMYKREIEKTFAVNARGDVDYRVQNYIQPIHAGDIICVATPPTEGIDGFDVLGTVLPAKNGEPAKLLAGQNTSLSEDKMKIVASMDGRLVYESGKFHVKGLFYVDGDVNLSVGNIDFLGDVHVRGDVREDFIIRATGSVTIDGIVEGALIEAGKDVIIAKGVLGDEKAVIQAGGNVQAEYIESCIVYAGGIVRASSIVSSYIYSDDQVVARVGRGTIIGGKIIAANLIDARVIGSRAERANMLVVGEKPYALHRKEKITQELEEIAKEKEEVEKMLKSVSRAIVETDPEKLQQAANFRLKKSVLAMQEAHLQKQMSEFEDTEIDFLTSRIKADIIYPVTRIRIHDLTQTVSTETSSCRVHVEDAQIKLM